MVEHDPVITLGRNAKRSNLLLSPELLAARGVDVVEIERGGDVTYHGPGQLVVYPIRKLARFREIVPLVSALERATVAALASFGLAAAGRKEHRGVYVGDKAIAAIGLAVRRMTSLHGLALNVEVALDYDRLITPCGTPEFGITSITHETGHAVTTDEAFEALKPQLEGEFGRARNGLGRGRVEQNEMTIDLIGLPEPERPRSKPEWLKVRLPHGDTFEGVRAKVRSLNLHTVCQEALCPNIGECWGAGTATIMILGDTCTRGCHFCNVKTGSPRGEIDWMEPLRVAEAVAEMGWSYLVLTAVDRDDLADGGAAIFASTVRNIHRLSPHAKVECLTGDFAGDLHALDIVLEARPEVLAHNLETVARLQSSVRDKRANYEQSLAILRHAHASGKVRYTKTSLMLGLGETDEEIETAMQDARAAGVDIFTMGQYLQPTKRHLPVVEFITPEKFKQLQELGYTKGFRQVVSSPLSRSSYHAEQAFAS